MPKIGAADHGNAVLRLSQKQAIKSDKENGAELRSREFLHDMEHTHTRVSSTFRADPGLRFGIPTNSPRKQAPAPPPEPTPKSDTTPNKTDVRTAALEVRQNCGKNPAVRLVQIHAPSFIHKPEHTQTLR